MGINTGDIGNAGSADDRLERSSQLDLVSESVPTPKLDAGGSIADKSKTATRPMIKSKPILFQFRCCRVAAQLTMPEQVLLGKSSTWRVHCPRCGLLTEISVVD